MVVELKIAGQKFANWTNKMVGIAELKFANLLIPSKLVELKNANL